MAEKTPNPLQRNPALRSMGLYDPFANLQREMERLFDGGARAWPFAPGQTGEGFLTPKVNVAETAAGLEITADLPGLEPEDIELDITDGVLTLKAEHKSEKEEKDEKKQYHLVERSYGTFLRRFALPFDVEVSKVDASFDKGVLKILAPRPLQSEKRPNKIAIKSS